MTILLTLEHSFKVVPNLSSPVLKIGGSYKLEMLDQCMPISNLFSPMCLK